MNKSTGVLDDVGRHLLALALLVVTAAAAWGFAHLAVTNVDGVVPVDEDSYETEFVNMEWWHATFLLAIPIFVGTWAAIWTAPLGVAVSIASVWHINSTNIERYIETGWGDGLETGFGLLYVIVEATLFIGAAAAAVLLRFLRRKRAARDQQGTTEPAVNPADTTAEPTE